MARLLLVVVILLALLLALFGIQNPQPIRIRFLNFTSGLIPLYVVILVSALSGVVLSTILSLRGRISSALRMRKQDQRIVELERRLAERPSVPSPAPVPVDAGPATSSGPRRL